MLEPGDHVWYWYDQQNDVEHISSDLDIPRSDWFPGSNPHDPTDYLGNGKDIYNFVIQTENIYRGRPQMRSGEGAFAWLDNNPGNLTGVPGGMDLGQYPGKFNWHHFLIFPDYQAGYDAIARFLREGRYPAKTTGTETWPAGRYSDLSIVDAFHRYAPKDDGNDPDTYAQQVAEAAGVSTSTLIQDLTDSQMDCMQQRIAVLEGADRSGTILAWDSEELPPAVRDLLA
jgi:hypothetical protein